MIFCSNWWLICYRFSSERAQEFKIFSVKMKFFVEKIPRVTNFFLSDHFMESKFKAENILWFIKSPSKKILLNVNQEEIDFLCKHPRSSSDIFGDDFSCRVQEEINSFMSLSNNFMINRYIFRVVSETAKEWNFALKRLKEKESDAQNNFDNIKNQYFKLSHRAIENFINFRDRNHRVNFPYGFSELSCSINYTCQTKILFQHTSTSNRNFK